MSDLYTVVVFITLFTLIINIMEVISNGLVSQKNKNEIIAVSLVSGIAVIGEWIGVETNGAASSLILLHKAAKLRPKYGDIFGISVGYAYCDGSKTTFAEAFKKADEMMYENKKINF